MKGPRVEVFEAVVFAAFDDLDIVPIAPMDCGPDGKTGGEIGGGGEFNLTIVIPLFDLLFKISVDEFNWFVDDCCWLDLME